MFCRLLLNFGCSELFPVSQSHKLIQNFLQSLEPPFLVGGCPSISPVHLRAVRFTDLGYFFPKLKDHVDVRPPADIKDAGLSPYYGWLVEILTENIRPDTSEGETPEIPLYESSRGPGSTADVDYWTSREAREVVHCHLNYVVPDTARWEQAASYYIDTHPMVDAFVKNAGLGFAIPYLHNGQMNDYMPDFIVRLKTQPPMHVIVETKGYDPLAEVKGAAADRWVKAVNAEGSHGQWAYGMARKTIEVPNIINRSARTEAVDVAQTGR